MVSAAADDSVVFGGYVELDAATGALLPSDRKRPPPFARDWAWRRELRAGAVVDLATGAALLDTGAYTLSGDGQYVFRAASDAAAGGTPSVVRLRVDGGAADMLAGIALGPPSAPVGDNFQRVAATAAGDHLLVASGADGRLVDADFTARTVRTVAVHAPLPANTANAPVPWSAGAVLSVALSPSGRQVATVGADRALRVWSYPDFAQRLPDIPVRWANAFAWCYCTPMSFARRRLVRRRCAACHARRERRRRRASRVRRARTGRSAASSPAGRGVAEARQPRPCAAGIRARRERCRHDDRGRRRLLPPRQVKRSRATRNDYGAGTYPAQTTSDASGRSVHSCPAQARSSAQL